LKRNRIFLLFTHAVSPPHAGAGIETNDLPEPCKESLSPPTRGRELKRDAFDMDNMEQGGRPPRGGGN